MRRDAGFTLLEVLVALAVLGFLLLGLGQGTSFGLQAWSRQERGIAADTELDAVDRTLRGLVTRLDPADAVGGGAHGLSFTSALPQSAALATSEADMAVGVEGGRLVLRWTPHVHAVRLGPAPAPQQAVLLEGVARLDVAYWATGGDAWLERWQAAAPPALVRFRLTFPASDPRHWADIVASPARVLPAR